MIAEISPPTLIAEGTRVTGSLTFISGVQVFGTVEGQIEQQSLEPLHIGRTGWVNGAILSQGPVVIEGRVDGDIVSTTRIRLLPTAIVTGALIAPAVDIRAGARFQGNVEMGKAKRASTPKKAAA